MLFLISSQDEELLPETPRQIVVLLRSVTFWPMLGDTGKCPSCPSPGTTASLLVIRLIQRLNHILTAGLLPLVDILVKGCDRQSAGNDL